MNPHDENQPVKRQEQKQHGGIPGDSDRQSRTDRNKADDRGRRDERQPDDVERAIPELDEPDVEGVGNEGRDNPARNDTD